MPIDMSTHCFLTSASELDLYALERTNRVRNINARTITTSAPMEKESGMPHPYIELVTSTEDAGTIPSARRIMMNSSLWLLNQFRRRS